MNKIEGNTLANLRRLHAEWQQATQEMIANGMKDIILHGDLSDKVIRLRHELEYELLRAAPALLGAIERGAKLERVAGVAREIDAGNDSARIYGELRAALAELDKAARP